MFVNERSPLCNANQSIAHAKQFSPCTTYSIWFIAIFPAPSFEVVFVLLNLIMKPFKQIRKLEKKSIKIYSKSAQFYQKYSSNFSNVITKL